VATSPEDFVKLPSEEKARVEQAIARLQETPQKAIREVNQ
jgi:hypothetical protein